MTTEQLTELYITIVTKRYGDQWWRDKSWGLTEDEAAALACRIVCGLLTGE